MMIRIKVDENISQSTVTFLKGYEFDVETVPDEGLIGHKDEEVIDFAKEEGRIVITLDKDFGDYLKFPMVARCGVVLLRLKHQYPTYVNARLKEFFDNIDLSILPRSLVVVSERKIRVRRLVA